jgi:hypothetical protein
MEEWVKNWLSLQREKGEVGLEVKKKSHRYFVYKSKTYWDKTLHKKRKTSEYIGRLDRERGLLLSGETIMSVNTVYEYGNAKLLFHAFEDLVPVLRKAFPDVWEDVLALSMIRVSGSVPLKSFEYEWNLVYDNGLKPCLDPRSLSNTLKKVGLDRRGQDMVFQTLGGGKELVYDLSCVFTKSNGVLSAENGYNKKRVHMPQLNLALLCSVDEDLPVMIRVIPGSVRDIKSLYTTLEEVGLQGKTLILDRGFFSEDLPPILGEMKIDYVLPARRNSHLYQDMELDNHFRYHERLILAGKKRHDSYYLYLFEDQDLKLDEKKNLYEMLDKGKMAIADLEESMKKAGRILILSNQDMPEKDLYMLYKKRDQVEKMFNHYKNMLDADRLYLQDNPPVFGHVFIGFLSLYGYCKILGMLKKAGLHNKLTPHDLLNIYKKVYMYNLDGKTMITEIPKNINDPGKKLGYHIHPQKTQS